MQNFEQLYALHKSFADSKININNKIIQEKKHLKILNRIFAVLQIKKLLYLLFILKKENSGFETKPSKVSKKNYVSRRYEKLDTHPHPT